MYFLPKPNLWSKIIQNVDINFYFYNNAIGTTKFTIIKMTDCDKYNTLTSFYYTIIILLVKFTTIKMTDCIKCCLHLKCKLDNFEKSW